MSNLKVSPYDPESDALFLSTGEKAAITHSLDPEWWVVLSFAAEDAYADIVSLELLDVSAYLPLGKRDYDQRTDTLLLGRNSSACRAVGNNDFVVYWAPDPDDPEWMIPVGVELKAASERLGHVRLRN